MKNSKEEIRFFKVREKGAGLDLVHLNYCPDSTILNEDFGYIHTSTYCANDNILADFVDQEVKTCQLVVDVDSVDKLGQIVLSHLSSIDHDWIDILEIPADCDWNSEVVDQLKTLIDSGIVYELSIKNPQNIDRLVEIKQLLDEKNIDIDYVSLDICPLNFNLDIINWCNDDENSVAVIGYNPFGGYINHPNVLSSFSAPYLLGFAATYCNIVFLSSRDLYKATQSAKYINNLYDKESELMYSLKKSVNKLQKPLKKVVYTSMILDNNANLPYDTPDYVPTGEDSILLNLGKSIEVLPNVDEYNNPFSSFEQEVYDFLNTLSYPSDASNKTKFCLAKNQIINYLRTKHTGYDILCSMINDSAIAVMATKEGSSGSWFRRTKVTLSNSYIIAMKSDGTVYFKEC